MTACARRQLPSWVFGVWVLMSCVHCHLTVSAAAAAQTSADPHLGSVQKRMFGVTRSSLCPPRRECGLWCAKILGCKPFCFKVNARINQILSDTVGNGTTHKQPSLQNRSRKSRVMKKPKNTAILFKSRFRPHVNKFFLKNTSVTYYPFIKEEGIVALAYVESLQRILIATKYPRQVVSVSLDGGTRHVIHKGLLVRDMAVDDAKQTVFLACKKPVIYRVSAKFEKRSVFKITTSWCIFSIAVDATNKLYASTRKEIFSVTHDGKERKVLARCMSKTVLALDPNGQALYFHMEKVLYKISLLNDVISVVISHFSNVHRLLYRDDRVYASPKDGDLLTIINTKSKKVQNASLSYDTKVKGDVIFCAIVEEKVHRSHDIDSICYPPCS